MFIKFLFLSILLLPAVGCSQVVGGTCTFETLYGTARIVELRDDKVFAHFNPGKQSFSNIKVPFTPQINFSVTAPFSGETGTVYPAQLAVITKGNCTPYRFVLLEDESFSQGIFLPFEREGNISGDGKQQLSQVAAIFKKLAPHWPQLMLNICGQTQREGSEEYNLSIGGRYAHMVAEQLEQAGVPSTQIRIKSSGEHPCPHSTIFADEVKNGVWLNFLLTGQDLPATAIR